MANSPFIKKGLKYGLVMGGMLIIIDLMLYIIGTNLFFSRANFALHIIAVPSAMILAGISLKQSNLGQIPYWKAVSTCFLCCLTILLAKGMFNVIMYNFVDSSLAPTLYEMYSDVTIDWMKSFKFSPKRIEQFVDSSRANPNLWNFSNGLRNIVVLAFQGLILSLILGLIFRRKRRGSYFR